MDKNTNLGQIFDTCWGKFQQNLQKDLVPNCIIGYQRVIAHNKKKRQYLQYTAYNSSQ